MAASENPQPDMIRITNEVAREILARGDAEVYRMMPGGAEELRPIEAAKPLSFEANRDIAIKRDDAAAGLERWANRTVRKALRQKERSENKKSQEPEV
jgi:hypothetical protein